MTKVLLVDDDIRLTEALRTHLQILLQMPVDEAPSAEDALDMMSESEYDVVVLDMVMPGMGGKGFLQRYRSVAPHAQVIVMTGFGTLDTAVTALAGGPDAPAVQYLLKPVRAEYLADTIRAVAGSLAADGFRVDLQAQKAFYNDEEIFERQGIAYKLLVQFLRYPNRPHTYQELVEAVYGEKLSVRAATKRLSTHMYRFRKALQELAGREVVSSHEGVGFTLKTTPFRRELS